MWYQLIDSAHTHSSSLARSRSLTYTRAVNLHQLPSLIIISYSIHDCSFLSVVQANRAVAIKLVREAENFMHFPTLQSDWHRNYRNWTNCISSRLCIAQSATTTHSNSPIVHVWSEVNAIFHAQTTFFIVSIAHCIRQPSQDRTQEKWIQKEKRKMCYFKQSASSKLNALCIQRISYHMLWNLSVSLSIYEQWWSRRRGGGGGVSDVVSIARTLTEEKQNGLQNFSPNKRNSHTLNW